MKVVISPWSFSTTIRALTPRLLWSPPLTGASTNCSIAFVVQPQEPPRLSWIPQGGEIRQIKPRLALPKLMGSPRLIVTGTPVHQPVPQDAQPWEYSSPSHHAAPLGSLPTSLPSKYPRRMTGRENCLPRPSLLPRYPLGGPAAHIWSI